MQESVKNKNSHAYIVLKSQSSTVLESVFVLQLVSVRWQLRKLLSSLLKPDAVVKS